jgi:hypothetical protein
LNGHLVPRERELVNIHPKLYQQAKESSNQWPDHFRQITDLAPLTRIKKRKLLPDQEEKVEIIIGAVDGDISLAVFENGDFREFSRFQAGRTLSEVCDAVEARHNLWKQKGYKISNDPPRPKDIRAAFKSVL